MPKITVSKGRLQSYLYLGADALTRRKSPMFKLGVEGETLCHSPMYLHDAIRNGEKARRAQRLLQLLQEIVRDEKQVTLYYAFNSIRYTMDMLLTGGWLVFEMRWALFSLETVDDFRRDINPVLIAATLAKAKIVELNLDEMKAKRKASNLDVCRPGKS